MMVERWFARCRGIKRTGPFLSQMVAIDAIRDTNGEPSPEAFVWPEMVKAKDWPKNPPKGTGA